MQGLFLLSRIISEENSNEQYKEVIGMKKITMYGAAGIMAMSLLVGAAGGTTADAKSKSRRCSVVKGCRVTGKHHSKKHHPKKCYTKKNHTLKHHSKTYYYVGHHSGHHK